MLGRHARCCVQCAVHSAWVIVGILCSLLPDNAIGTNGIVRSSGFDHRCSNPLEGKQRKEMEFESVLSLQSATAGSAENRSWQDSEPVVLLAQCLTSLMARIRAAAFSTAVRCCHEPSPHHYRPLALPAPAAHDSVLNCQHLPLEPHCPSAPLAQPRLTAHFRLVTCHSPSAPPRCRPAPLPVLQPRNPWALW